MSERSGAIVGIVAFRPTPEHLFNLARSASAEAAHVIVFVNGVLAAPLAASLREIGAELIEADCNLGIAEALNRIALAAGLRGAARVMLLDEDAVWSPGTLGLLCGLLDTLQAAGETAAVIGPRIVAPRSGYIAPRYFSVGGKVHDGAHAVRYLITSGSLVCLEAFREIGPFRSDFFIDMVDVEWCFRAQSKGYSCWCADDVTVEHSVGQGEVRALGMRATRQPQFRFRAYARNLSHCFTLAHVPWLWKLRLAANLTRLCLVYQFSAEPGLYRWIWREIWDGLAGKLGPPRGAHNTKALDIG